MSSRIRLPNKAFFLNILWYLLGSTGVAIILLVRNSMPFSRPEFWAEDADFFIGALSLGAESVLTPVWGYHFFSERVIAYFATAFPVVCTTLIYAVSALILNAISIGYFAKDGFSWLVRSRILRMLICLILAVGPGAAEVTFNLINSATPLTLLALLLLIEKPFTLGPLKFIVIVIILFSSGSAFLMAPMVGYLWYSTKQKRYLALFACFIIVTIINFTGVTAPTSPTVQQKILNFENILLVPRVMLENGLYRLFILPFFGDNLTPDLMKAPNHIFWSFSFLCVALFTCLSLSNRAIHKYKEKFLVLGIAYCCIIGMFAVILIARNGITVAREFGNTYWFMRYSFLPGCLSILIWGTVFSHFLRRGIMWKLLALVGSGLICFHISTQWKNTYNRPDLDWPTQAYTIQESLDMQKNKSLKQPVTVQIRAHPGWVRPITISP